MNNYTMLDQLVKNSKSKILDWIEAEYNNSPKPIYTSVDIRNAGFKIAHVDTNIFPSGFNNASDGSKEIALKLLASYMQSNFPKVRKMLLVPENFTRNINYLKNLKVLEGLFSKAGFQVKVGSPYITEEFPVAELDLHIYPISKKENEVYIGTFIPDLLVLNNDLTLGLHEIFKNIKQPIIPNTNLGWFKRRKTNHFNAHSEIAEKFAKEFGFDSWLISTYVQSCGNIDFRKKQGIECIANKVEEMLASIKAKYSENNIKSEPFIFIKSDMGTYGMGVMPVKSAEEVLHINKKHRHSMDVIKHGVHNSDVIIQEGVPTIELTDNHAAESMAYLINGTVFDLITRVNEDKDQSSNLNTHGMYFKSNIVTEFNIKTCIASLATLAVTKELV
jgi:glutamate--cysteine ligase